MTCVVIIDDGYDYDAERSSLSPVGADVVLRPCRDESEAVVTAIRDADAMLVRKSPVAA